MGKSVCWKQLDKILERAEDRCSLNREEIGFLLALTEEKDLDLLFRAARRVRSRHFEDKVFLYGFLYFNTECSNNCLFCQYRKANTMAQRYTKSTEEIQEVIELLADSGVHLVDLTMGELAAGTTKAEEEYARLCSFMRMARNKSDIPFMVSPGVVSNGVIHDLAAAGATWYACYQETYNRSLFFKVRAGQSFTRRMAAKTAAGNMGMLIEEGMLIGIGESVADRADNIVAMRELGADQVRVMTLVPQRGTPLAQMKVLDEIEEQIVIAVMRLTMPDRLIPASLDVGGLAGLRKRLQAGANVVSSLVLPGKGLAGVANQKLDIEQARRTPEAIQPILSGCGLQPATLGEYKAWIDARTKFNSAAEKVA